MCLILRKMVGVPLKVLVVVAINLFFTSIATAYDFMVDGLAYNIIAGTNNVRLVYTAFNSDENYYGMTDVEIPESVVCDNAQYAVKSIGDYAFAQCVTLKSIVVPNSVVSIGEMAFKNCRSLKSVDIPSSISSIARMTFYGCNNLKRFTMPAEIRSIGSSAFNGCISLDSLYIPKYCSTITVDAFCDTRFSSIVVDPENYKYNSNNQCNAIIETSTRILLVGCKNTVIPNNVKEIGAYAFRFCRNLTSIDLPPSVQKVGVLAFSSCNNLKKVSHGENVEYIGESAFAFCASVDSIFISSTVTYIGDKAFNGCGALSDIRVEDNNNFFDSRGNCNAVIRTRDNALLYGCKNTIIPNSVVAVEDGAFHSCTGLKSMKIPNSVMIVGQYVFKGCVNLSTVVLGRKVDALGYRFFHECSSLRALCLSSSNPPVVGNEALLGVDYEKCHLYVPSSSLQAYANDSEWGKFKNIVAWDEISLTKGNVNLDGTVDISDINTIINALLQKGNVHYFCDTNLDGVVDISDVNLAINSMLGKR